MARIAEEIPRSRIDNALRMIGLPVDTTDKQIRALFGKRDRTKVNLLEEWKKQYKEIYDPARWKDRLTEAQIDLLERRYIDTIGAYNELLLWQQGKTDPVTPQQVQIRLSKELREAEQGEMEARAAEDWMRDTPNRLERIQAERERQTQLRLRESERIRERNQKSAEWEAFQRTWRRITFDKSPEWRKTRPARAMERAAWIMYQHGEDVTRNVARVLENRFGTQSQRFTPEMKRTALAWYQQMAVHTVRRWVEEMKMHPGGRLQIPAKLGYFGNSGFGTMFGG